MFNNQNYPWYIQKSATFVRLYEGLYEIAKDISPLALGDSFNINTLQAGLPLYQLGAVWGLPANPKFVNGLTYDLDPWSETKVWSGGVATLDDKLYRNFLRMKIFVQNNPYSLTTLKKALELLVGEEEAQFSVEEKEMEFVINIKSNITVINTLQTFNSFDRYFLGQPCGVRYGFNYEVDKE
jgi:hypothetical protein